MTLTELAADRLTAADPRPDVTARPRNPEIIAQPPSALRIIALSIGIEIEEARLIVRALAKAGFVVAPLEPTNSMFSAYMDALNSPPTRHETVIRNVGKARKRWKAMAQAGVAVAFSDLMIDGLLPPLPHNEMKG